MRNVRKRRQRGTAMVELAIIAPLMIFTWAAINYFRTQYLMAQQVMHESRTQAWAYATSGKCQGPPTPSLLLADDWGSFGAEALAAFETFPNHGTILQATASVDAKVGRTPPSSTSGYGFSSSEVAGRTYLHCNDDLPNPRDTALPWMLPIGLKELSVQP